MFKKKKGGDLSIFAHPLQFRTGRAQGRDVVSHTITSADKRLPTCRDRSRDPVSFESWRHGEPRCRCGIGESGRDQGGRRLAQGLSARGLLLLGALVGLPNVAGGDGSE